MNLYLYSSFHISLGAGLLVYGVFLTLAMPPQLDYIVFVFFSTLLMYSIHRIIGLDKMKYFQEEGRYAIIFKYRQHIIIYALLAAIACCFLFYHFDRSIQFLLLVAIALSGAYVLPLFGNKRLRDLGYIKIFIIALSWAFIAVTVPLEIMGISGKEIHILIFIEKAAFIFGLTIPFDVRDIEYDQHSKVRTIPQKLGLRKSIALSLGLIDVAIIASIYLYLKEIYTLEVLIAGILVYLITYIAIWKSKNKSSDYYFTGLLDGMIILYGLAIIIACQFFQ